MENRNGSTCNQSDRLGQLWVVGTGIKLGQVTLETMGVLESADIVLTVVGCPIMMSFIVNNCKAIEDLVPLYEEGKDRLETYREMTERVMTHIRDGKQTCFAVYGHPGVLSLASHEAISLARAEGYQAEMLPGVSAEACLVAELGIDIGHRGMQSYEATSFLVWNKQWDRSTPLILWQIGVIGDPHYRPKLKNLGIGYLVESLTKTYGAKHEVTIYEAATLPFHTSRIERMAVSELGRATLTLASTLFVPPSGPQNWDEQLYKDMVSVHQVPR